MSARRRRHRLEAASPGEAQMPINQRQAKLLAEWRRRRHQALRAKFTNRQWERAADLASADRRQETGNGRYTPPRVRQG